MTLELFCSTRIGADVVGGGVGFVGVVLVVDVLSVVTSNASTVTHVPPEEELLVPVTSIARVWLPEARPVTEYIFGCA